MRELFQGKVEDYCFLEDGAAHSYAVHSNLPQLVFAPRTPEEAAILLKIASEHGLRVECAGSGTRLNGGNRAPKVDVVITSHRLNHIAEYEPADLVISVESGVTFPQLQNVVGSQNQFLALDPPVSNKSTVGAAIATASAGPLRLAHGGPRDQVLGLEVVTSDGRVLNFGGRVVKNVAGYDVVRLMVGSRGTLGFITRINVRLKPQPDADRSIAFAAATFDEIHKMWRDVVATGIEPAAAEIVSYTKGAWTLLLRLQGNNDAVADAETRINAAVAEPARQAVGPADWQRLSKVEAEAKLVIRAANTPTQLAETMDVVMRMLRGCEIRDAIIAAHAGDGIVRSMANEVRDVSGLRDARGDVENQGGTLVVERSPVGLDFNAFGDPEALSIMKEIKKVFDPAGILGVDRFVL